LGFTISVQKHCGINNASGIVLNVFARKRKKKKRKKKKNYQSNHKGKT